MRQLMESPNRFRQPGFRLSPLICLLVFLALALAPSAAPPIADKTSSVESASAFTTGKFGPLADGSGISGRSSVASGTVSANGSRGSVTAFTGGSAILPFTKGVPPLAVRFSSGSYTVSENAGTATITVTLSAASSLTVTVNYATSDGTALAGSDYVTATGTLTFTPGVTSQIFNVTIINDTLVEPDETLILALSNPANASLGVPSTATLTILDDDATPTPTNTPTSTPTPTATATPTVALPTATPTLSDYPMPPTLTPAATVSAQGGTYTYYLPRIASYYPALIKTKSGIHFGSRSSDWPANTLSRLRGKMENPTTEDDYAAVVVVLSDNLYDIQRNGTGCRVSGVSYRNKAAFDYLIWASKVGTKVIIRIDPSPGNFVDALDPNNPNLTHSLLTGVGETPGGASYCGRPNNTMPFRGVDDMALEIKAIHVYNKSSGFYEYGFEPANEPNNEWYPSIQDINLFDSRSWSQMDTYFTNLYDQVHPSGANPDIRVLTPPMSQFNFAEPKNYRDCTDTYFDPLGYPNKSGYDLMPNTFGLNSPTKNDGYNWHNYWRLTKENWAGTSPNSAECTSGTFPISNHIFQFFPQWLRDKIVTSPYPRIISEADLYSPCKDSENNLTDKDFQASNYAAPSLRAFIQQEKAAGFVAIWNLSIEYSDSTSCIGLDNDEFAWHEAYRENGTERLWFPLWWLGNE